MLYTSSDVGRGGFGGHEALSGEALRFVARELNGDSELSLQRVQHIPVGVSGSAVLCWLGEFLLEHSNLGHGFVYITNFRFDQMHWVVDWVPSSRVTHCILRQPPIIPRENGIVNWVLDMGNKTEGKLLPVLIFIVVSSQKLIQFLNLLIDILDCLGSSLSLK